MLNHPQQGEFSAAAFSISATPFVTSSAVPLGGVAVVDFGWLSKFIVVRNTTPSSSLAVAFTENGLTPAASNFFTLGGEESFSADLRVVKLFLSGAAGDPVGFTVVAGLTTVPERMSMTLTGSNGFPGVG